VAEAKRQLAAHPEITCFVLDDGFQHRRARRDLDLVLVDATNPWGYGATLPRGLLREKKAGLRRADAVIVTRADRVDAGALAALEKEIQAVAGRAPLALARHGWEGFRVWKDGAEDAAPVDALQSARVAVVCGIGNPAAFAAQAQGCAQVVMVQPMADHAAWSPALFAGVVEQALAAGAAALLTTEKDFVKWRPILAGLRTTLPVYRPLLAMQFPQGGDALATLLASRIPFPNARTAS
jgi:tetraacyldisaccharide 4'-kinase